MDRTYLAKKTPTVLLVDDDLAMVRLLTKWLESAGFRVQGAFDGYQARAAIESECPQFLITDLEMPGITGMELCCWLRAQNLPSYVYTVIVTARGTADDMVRGLESGADDFLRKPINRNELLARMRAGMRVLDLESRLSLLASCDSLTSLYSQRTFFEFVRKEWARSHERKTPMSCVMLDIDYFKRINDTYGHSTGDEVIRWVARILENHTRSSDIASRFGGEEFCVLLPQLDEQQAAAWAERVRRIIAQTEIACGETSLHVTASFGAAQRMDDTESPEELVDMADQALLVSKQTGRDRVTSFLTMNDSTRIAESSAPTGAFGKLLARDVMTTLVAGLHEGDKVGRAVDYFLQLRINSAPVVDDRGRLVGVLSEKDAMAILLWPDWREATIAEVMRKAVVAYDEETPADVVYEFLCRVAIRSVIVVKDGRPTGVISRASLLRWFTNALVSRGEGVDWDAPRPAESPAEAARQVVAIADALADHALVLKRDFGVDAGEWAPRIVGSASRMQELLNDLLAYSRYVAPPLAEEPPVADDTVQGYCALFAHPVENG
jgi:two-component system, cell cycle response regulator